MKKLTDASERTRWFRLALEFVLEGRGGARPLHPVRAGFGAGAAWARRPAGVGVAESWHRLMGWPSTCQTAEAEVNRPSRRWDAMVRPLYPEAGASGPR